MTDPEHGPVLISRRAFLKLSGLAALAVGASLAGCQVSPATPQPLATAVPDNALYPEVPETPATPPPSGVLRSFTSAEAQLVEALTARIMPGLPDDPGAREAGVMRYIDTVLTFHDGIVEPTYTSGPFAEAYEGDNPPAQKDPNKVYVKKDDLPRYGFQSSMTPKQAYRAGLSALDRYAGDKFNKKFVDLSEDQQDQIVADLVSNKATGFDKPSADSFFKMVRQHTIEGFFADPAYGGNIDMVGWTLIGYPGAQRAYTPLDLKDEKHIRPPQSLAMLHHFHPGQPVNPDVILPVSGSDEQRPQPPRTP